MSPGGSHVRKNTHGSGLTAGWLFSCLATTPNMDDMADNPVESPVMRVSAGKKMRASLRRISCCFLQAWMYSELHSTVSQSHNATAVHIYRLLGCISCAGEQLLKKAPHWAVFLLSCQTASWTRKKKIGSTFSIFSICSKGPFNVTWSSSAVCAGVMGLQVLKFLFFWALWGLLLVHVGLKE